jgi:purine-nucleoside phosphorylase
MKTAPDEAFDNRNDAAPEPGEFARAGEAAQFVLGRMSERAGAEAPRIAVILGSGLEGFADSLHEPLAIPYQEIPHFPRATAIGHAGRLVIGKLVVGQKAAAGDAVATGLSLAVMQGRVHQYEGYSSRQAAFPVRVLARMGVRALVLTNAAGGINPAYRQGALVLISDHINLQGANPLTGPNDPRLGPRFPDMTEAYSRAYRGIALEEGRRHDIELPEGIYAALAGPHYETPAEIRYLRAIGADLVGMSTVPEVIAARHMGLGVLAISCVTNMAAGMSPQEITHEEVLAIGARVRGKLTELLAAVLPRIEESLRA